MSKRKLTMQQAESDANEVDRILQQSKRTWKDTQRLIYLFNWYVRRWPDSSRFIPPDLLREVAAELVKFGLNRKYRLFGPLRTGRPPVVDWDAVEAHADLLMEMKDLDNPDEPDDPGRAFDQAIEKVGIERPGHIHRDTLPSRRRLYIERYER